MQYRLFELLTAIVGPRASLLQCSDLAIENALWRWKLGQNMGRILTVKELVFTFQAPDDSVKFIKIE